MRVLRRGIDPLLGRVGTNGLTPTSNDSRLSLKKGMVRNGLTKVIFGFFLSLPFPCHK